MIEQLARIAAMASAHPTLRTAAALRLDESGTDVAEYALLFAMLGLSLVATLGSLSELVANLFSHVGTTFSNAA